MEAVIGFFSSFLLTTIRVVSRRRTSASPAATKNLLPAEVSRNLVGMIEYWDIHHSTLHASRSSRKVTVRLRVELIERRQHLFHVIVRRDDTRNTPVCRMIITARGIKLLCPDTRARRFRLSAQHRVIDAMEVAIIDQYLFPALR